MTNASSRFGLPTQTIGTYLIALLTAPGGITADSMVVVLNAIFDTYADENSPWDAPVFRQGNFLQALKSSVTKIRGIVRPLAPFHGMTPAICSPSNSSLAADPRGRQAQEP